MGGSMQHLFRFLSFSLFILTIFNFHGTKGATTTTAASSTTKCTLPKSTAKASTTSKTKKCTQLELDSASLNVNKHFEDYWQWKLNEYPEITTRIGQHQYNDRLSDNSLIAFDHRNAKRLEFVKEINLLEPCTRGKDLENLKVLKSELSNGIEGYEFKTHFLPINGAQGFEKSLIFLFQRMPNKTQSDFLNMIRRMEKIPNKINNIILLMKKGMRDNITHHHHAVKKIPENLKEFIVTDPTKHPFYKFFSGNFPQSFSQEEIISFQQKAQNIIKEKISPAFDSLSLFMLNEYKTRPKIASNSLPNGKKYYERMIRFSTSSTYTATQIHDIGLCEVSRIRSEMKKTVEEMGHVNKELSQALQDIKNDPTNHYSTKEEVLTGYENIIKKVDIQLPKLFKKIPTLKVIMKEDPSPTAIFAYYRSASFDGTQPGVFYVATNDLKANKKYFMLSLTLHEASPGHHHQISHTIEAKNTPNFRKIYFNNAFGEGWALYAETLGFDMDLYNNPADRLGFFNFQLLRACRLVVDTGLHSKGWTREAAVNYMASNLAMDLNYIGIEVDRYIAWPGQALGYKIGQLRIEAMRQKSEEQLKTNFDIKEFHDVILSFGSAPMDLIEEAIDQYIKKNLPV